MPVAWTSRLALVRQVDSLEGRKAQVYEAILDWKPGRDGTAPAPCRDEIAEITGLRLSSVCGRVSELIALGCVELGPLKPNPITGEQVTTLFAVAYRPARTRSQLLAMSKAIYPEWPVLQTRLLAVCETRGMAAQLARDLQVSDSTVRHWLRGSEPAWSQGLRLYGWLLKHG